MKVNRQERSKEDMTLDPRLIPEKPTMTRADYVKWVKVNRSPISELVRTVERAITLVDEIKAQYINYDYYDDWQEDLLRIYKDMTFHL